MQKTNVGFEINMSDYDFFANHSHVFYGHGKFTENYKVEIHNGCLFLKTDDNTIVFSIDLPKPKELSE